MKQRKLGGQGMAASELGYGAMGTAGGYGATDDTESISAIRRAFELGVTHFDTAEFYGWGEGERLLGSAVAPFRDQVTIATKFGMTRDWGFDSRPEHIRKVLDSSLRNLKVETIDLLYQHRVDPKVPMEDVVGTMKEFVEAGKLRYLGLSEAGPDIIRAAHRVYPISVVQSEYSIFARENEEILPVLEELDIGFVAYSPLARGFLAGAAKPIDQYDKDDYRLLYPWWNPENFDQNAHIVEELVLLAESKGVSISQLSLAWLLAQKNYIVPIPGSRNPRRVEENVAAAAIVLSDEDLARISEIAPHGGIGGRGTEGKTPRNRCQSPG